MNLYIRPFIYFIAFFYVIMPAHIAFPEERVSSGEREFVRRISKLSAFYSVFAQKVIDNQDGVLYEASGELCFQKPHFFRLETLKPDQNVLVSDGKALWFYDPQLAQVTIQNAKEAIEGTLFELLLNAYTAEEWNHRYHITASGDRFLLRPKPAYPAFPIFGIVLSAAGKLLAFTIEEEDGQKNEFSLRHLNQRMVGEPFSFTPPDGVVIDDQRN